MALNKVEICGVNTSSLPVLKQEEKDELFRRIKQGDTEAREQYIKGNLRLVLSVIRRFQNSNENPDDLFQIGCIGLMKAVDNFDDTLMVKFSTYAVPMIIGEIRRYLRDYNSNANTLTTAGWSAIYAIFRVLIKITILMDMLVSCITILQILKICKYVWGCIF